MLYIYSELSSLEYFDGNRSFNLDLNKLEKPYLDVFMSQISSKSVQ